MSFYKVVNSGQTYTRAKDKFLELGGKESLWRIGATPANGEYVALVKRDENYCLVFNGSLQFVIDIKGLEEIKKDQYELNVGDKVVVIEETNNWGEYVQCFDIGVIKNKEDNGFRVDFHNHKNWFGHKRCFMPIKVETPQKDTESAVIAKDSIVKVLNNGKVYPSATQYAERLKATNWKSGNSFSNGTVCKIINYMSHPDIAKELVVLIEDLTGEQVLIGDNGLAKASKAEIDEFNKVEEVKEEIKLPTDIPIGSHVTIVNTGLIYPDFERMAKAIGATNWKSGTDVLEKDVYKVVSIAEHLDHKATIMYLIEDSQGKQYLIERAGIKLTDKKPEEVKEAPFKHGDQIICIKSDYPHSTGAIKIYDKPSPVTGMFKIKGSNIDFLFDRWKIYIPEKVTEKPKVTPEEWKLGDKLKCIIGDYPYKRGDIVTFVSWLNPSKNVFNTLEDKISARTDRFKKYVEGEDVTVVKEKRKIVPWQSGEKLICTAKTYRPVEFGEIVTFKSPSSSCLYFHCEEYGVSLLKSCFKRASLVVTQKEEVQIKKTKTIGKEKEIVMSKGKGIVDRIKEGANIVVSKQGDIAKTAALLEGARVLNNQLVKAISPKLPFYAKGYADTAMGRAVLANILMFGMETAFPDVPETDVRKQIAKAAVITSYQEVIQELDIEGMVNKIFESPALAKITKKFSDGTDKED